DVWGGCQQADPLQFLTYVRYIETQDIEHSGAQISQLHLLGYPLPGGEQLRIAHEQGHVNKRVVQTIGMAHTAVIATVFATISGSNEERAVQPTTLASPGHERPNLGIEAGEGAIVARLQHPKMLI